MEEQLPDSWVDASVDEVTLPVHKINQKDNPEKVIEYIDIGSIDNQKNKVADVKSYKISEAPSRARQIVQAGDVLFATVRPYLRNIAAVPTVLDGEIASTGFAVLRPANGVEPSYLYYLCISYPFVNALSGIQYGVSYPAVKNEQVLAQTFPLPPENEQKRIVGKIEELCSELDKGIESLKTARTQLKIYRQAVLKHAFEGKLTANWREENKDKLESTDELLKRIKQKRETHYQQKLEDCKTALKTWEQNGKEGKKPSKPPVFKEPQKIGQEERDLLPHIPDDWLFVRLSEIAKIGSGMSVSAARKINNPINVPYLRVANVQRGFLDLSEIKKMSIEKGQLDHLKLKKWDILFNEGGDRDKLGRGWVWQSEIQPCITQNHVFRATPYISSELTSKIISHWGNTFGQKYFEKTGKQTTNLASINKGVLGAFPIPLISPAEEAEIYRGLDRITTIIDAQEIEVSSALQKSEALRQSILKKAFSGQLVAQDPTDEPASALLERIKAEKETIKKPKKRKAA